MSSGTGIITPDAVLPGATRRFLRALEMLFRAGRYYPADHARTAELTDAFRAAAAEVAPDGGALVFAVHDGVLTFQGEALPDDAPGAKGLLELLVPLAVARLTIDPGIPRAGLHRLTTLLPELQQQVLASDADERFAFRGLPDGVAIDQREFVVGGDDELEELWEELRERILKAVRELEDLGLAADRVMLCRHLLRGFGARVAAAVESAAPAGGNPAADGPDLPRTAGDDTAAVARNLDTLTDILEQSMLGDDAHRTEETFRRLIGILERSVPESWRLNACEVHHLVDREEGLEIPELMALLGPPLPAGWRPPAFDGEDRRETVSMLCGLLTEKTGASARRRLRGDLERLVAGGLGADELGVLHGAAAALVRGPLKPEELAGLSDLVRAYRLAPDGSTLSFLLGLDDACPPRNREAFWPLLANEVLLGGEGESPEIVAVAQARLDPLPDGPGLQRALDDLRGREAVAEERFDDHLVRSPPQPLTGLLSALLRHGGDDALVRRLRAGLHARPASWLCACVLPLIDPANGAHGELYALMLEQIHEKQALPQLKILAREMLLDRLSTLTSERRGDDWVPGSILVLGRLPGDGVSGLLERVLRERRRVLLPAWPRACREAAAAALARIRARTEEGPS